MTGDLAQACADLTTWLPAAHALTTQPDIQGMHVHAKPESRPPWNQAAANLWLDVHAAVREIEENMRYNVTGSVITRGSSDANTAKAIAAIGALSAAVDSDFKEHVTRRISLFVKLVQQLPALDLEERARQVPAPCPRCERPMLRIYERSGRVACLGCGNRGHMMPGTISDGYIEWQDGELT